MHTCHTLFHFSSPLFAKVHTRTHTYINTYKAHRSSYFISQRFSLRGSSLFSQKVLGVGETCELQRSLVSGDAQLHTTLPLSPLVYSPTPSLSPSACPWCLTCRSDSRGNQGEGGRTTAASRLQSSLSLFLKEKTASNKKKQKNKNELTPCFLSCFLSVCVSVGVQTTGQHIYHQQTVL